MKTQLKVLAAIVALTAISGPAISFAEDELLQEAQTVLNSEQIDIDADYEEPAELTAQELLEQARKKSEMNNVKVLAKKISTLKVSKAQAKEITQKEAESLNNRITSIFGHSDKKEENATSSNNDAVSTQQAAPQQVRSQVLVVEAPTKKQALDNVRVIPSFGVTSIQGDGINIESKYSVGLDVETMVSERVSIGLGIGYSTLEMMDIEDSWSSNPYYYDYSELELNQLEVRVNSKVFLTTESKFRPYIGVGLSYNRVNMKYTSEDDSYNSWYYRNYSSSNIEEEFSSGFVSANLAIGAEVRLTDNIGLTVEGKYSKGLTGGLANDTVLKTDRQARLDLLGEAVTDSNFLTLNGGLLVTF